MKFKWMLALVAAVLMFTTSAFAADPNPKFYIYLAFGQSNMEGYPMRAFDPQDLKVDPRYQVLAAVDMPKESRTKGNWYDATPPLCRDGCGLCPVDYFGRTLVMNLPPDVKVGVVNVAVAGCKIELFDKDNFKTYASTQAAWMTNIIKQYNGNPYQYLVDMGKRAQQDGVIKGFLLHQGESNSGDRQWPTKVKGIYDNLCKDLNLKPEEAPLLAGELAKNAGMNAIIDKLPETIPTSYVISAKGCPDRGDGLHFTPAAYREFGTRYGVQMLKLMGQKEADIKLPVAPASQPATQPAGR